MKLFVFFLFLVSPFVDLTNFQLDSLLKMRYLLSNERWFGMMFVYSSVVAYEDDKEQHGVLNRILSVCEKFEGKTITKRIVTHLNEAMEGFHFWFDGTSLTVYDKQNRKLSFCVPSDKVWNREAIYNRTAIAYGKAAEDRIRMYEAYLNSEEKKQIEKIDSEISELEKRIEELKTKQETILNNFQNGCE